MITADQVELPSNLLSLLPSLGSTSLLALGVVSFWKGWIVPGSTHRAVVKQRDDLQEAIVDKVIPAVTEANVTMRQISALIQTDVSIKRRPE